MSGWGDKNGKYISRLNPNMAEYNKVMTELIRWTVQDRFGSSIYLTQERWEHIIESINHPEMEEFEKELKETIKSGTRKQDTLNPQKYRYSKDFDNLQAYNTHIVAIVLFSVRESDVGEIISNNFVVTAYQKEIG
jgi:hypothetical protein